MTEYNLPNEKIINLFEWYEGRNVEQMPELMGDGRVPIAIAGLMQQKLDVRNCPRDIKTAWMDNDFDSSDLVCYGSKKIGDKLKYILTIDNQNKITKNGYLKLSLINPKEKLINGAINLGFNNQWENLQGEGVINLSIKELGIINKRLIKEKASDSKLWRIALRHPDEVPKGFEIDGLHKAAIDYIFAEVKRLGYDTAMGVYPDSLGNNPSMRTWRVGWIGSGSGADGRTNLYSEDGLFAGLVLGKGVKGVRKPQ